MTIRPRRRLPTPSFCNAEINASITDAQRRRFATPADFQYIGSQLASKYHVPYDMPQKDYFQEFGVTAIVASQIWNDLILVANLKSTAEPLHLMWWLYLV